MCKYAVHIYILCVCKFLHASYVQITFSASKSWSFFQSVSVGAADPDKRPGNLAFFCSVCGFLGKSPPPNCDGCASKNLYHQSLQKFPLEHCHLITAILKNVEGLVLTDFCSTWGVIESCTSFFEWLRPLDQDPLSTGWNTLTAPASSSHYASSWRFFLHTEQLQVASSVNVFSPGAVASLTPNKQNYCKKDQTAYLDPHSKSDKWIQMKVNKDPLPKMY